MTALTVPRPGEIYRGRYEATLRNMKAKTMELVMLAVPDCPNAPAMLQRLEQVLPQDAAPVDVRVITTEEQAAQNGMHGSPTLLINGSDPFAPPDAAAGVSCRIYRNTDGRTSGAPSIEQLADALKRADRST